MSPPAIPDYREQSHSEKFWEKSKKEPFVPIGFGGLLAMLGYGAYSYRNKGKMSTSVFLMHLRVKAQAMVVGAMAVGVTATMIRDYTTKK